MPLGLFVPLPRAGILDQSPLPAFTINFGDFNWLTEKEWWNPGLLGLLRGRSFNSTLKLLEQWYILKTLFLNRLSLGRELINARSRKQGNLTNIFTELTGGFWRSPRLRTTSVVELFLG